MVEIINLTLGQTNFLKWVLDYKSLTKRQVIHLKSVIHTGTYWKDRDKAKTMNDLRERYLVEYKEWLKN